MEKNKINFITPREMAKMNAEFAEWHKSKLPTKEELLSKGIPEHVIGTAQKYAFKSQYHVEKWYSHIEACTMPTVTIHERKKQVASKQFFFCQ